MPQSILHGDLADLARRFAECRLPRAEWTHQAHLIVGAWYVERCGADAALTRLRAGIRRLNDSNGVVNSTTGGYHETITRAYVHLLSEFLQIESKDEPLSERAERLLASPLADRDVLFRFYSRDRLMSAEARLQWVEPDLCPLRVADLLRSDVAR